MEEKKRASKAKINASRKYNEKTYTRKTVSFRKAEAKAVDDYCKLNNISFNSLVTSLVLKAIEYDKVKEFYSNNHEV